MMVFRNVLKSKHSLMMLDQYLSEWVIFYYASKYNGPGVMML